MNLFNVYKNEQMFETFLVWFMNKSNNNNNIQIRDCSRRFILKMLGLEYDNKKYWNINVSNQVTINETRLDIFCALEYGDTKYFIVYELKVKSDFYNPFDEYEKNAIEYINKKYQIDKIENFRLIGIKAYKSKHKGKKDNVVIYDEKFIKEFFNDYRNIEIDPILTDFLNSDLCYGVLDESLKKWNKKTLDLLEFQLNVRYPSYRIKIEKDEKEIKFNLNDNFYIVLLFSSYIFTEIKWRFCSKKGGVNKDFFSKSLYFEKMKCKERIGREKTAEKVQTYTELLNLIDKYIDDAKNLIEI